MANFELKVKEIIADQLSVHISDVNDSTSFGQDLGVDSLAKVELLMRLEGEFAIDIPDEVAADIGTVHQAIDYISAATPHRIAKRSAPQRHH